MSDVQEVIEAWRPYVEGIDNWQALVTGIEPKQSGCGAIYEFVQNPVEGRPDEDFCIADMTGLKVTQPHYHPEDAYEIYYVVAGAGHIVVGNEVDRDIQKGDVVVMSPMTTHYTVPLGSLVVAVVNTPPFRPELYVPVDPSESDMAVQFDKARFDQLANS